MRTLITNGTIVTADGSTAADVLIDGETIAQIGRDLAGAGVTADETIDAAGKYVIPGAIDVHTHMELPFGGTFAKDTFETGTRAAAFGGTTSIVDFAVQSRGRTLREGLDTWLAKAEGNAVTDYGFHMIMSDVNDESLREMDLLVGEGIPDFKLFTAYPGVFYSDDGAIFRAMQQTRRNGGLIMMHAENGMAIDVVAADEIAAGHTDPYYHGIARYPVFEGEATNRVIRLAEAAGVPVYIVHLSARDALDEVRARARPRHEGVRRDLPAVPVPVARRHGQRVRGREVRLLAAAPDRPTTRTSCGPGSSRTTSSSSRPTTARSTSTARRSSAGATSGRSPTACPGVEDRVDLLHDGGVVGGRISRERWVEIDLDGAGQAVRDVPAQGRGRGRLGRGPRRSTTRTRSGRSAPRPTTWTSTTRATRAGSCRAAPTSSCRAARSSSATASSPAERATADSSSAHPRTSPARTDASPPAPAAMPTGTYRLRGKPRSTLDVPGSGQRDVTTLVRV